MNKSTTDTVYSVAEKTAAKRIIQAKPDMMASFVPHTCSTTMCNPENELSLLHRGLLSGTPKASHVYVCNLRRVHVCKRDTCDLFRETPDGTCPISAIHYANHQYSTYSRADPMSWYSKPSNVTCNTPVSSLSMVNSELVEHKHISATSLNRRKLLNRSDVGLFDVKKLQAEQKEVELEKEKQSVAVAAAATTTTTTTTTMTTTTTTKTTNTETKQGKKRRSRSNAKKKQLKESARSLIQLLLYSSNRIRINDETRAKHLRARDKHRDEYIRMCKQQRQRTVLSDFARFNIFFLNLPVPLAELELDDAKIDNLQHIIMHVWSLVEKYYDLEKSNDACKIDFTSVALGTLYTMRQGYLLNGIEVLPQDVFLAYHLPKMKDLSRFHLAKRGITKGEKILAHAYDNAVARGASQEELLIDWNKLRQRGEAGQWKKFKKLKAGRSSTVFLKQ